MPLANIVHIAIACVGDDLNSVFQAGGSAYVKVRPLLAVGRRREQANNVNAAVVGINTSKEHTSGLVGKFSSPEARGFLQNSGGRENCPMPHDPNGWRP